MKKNKKMDNWLKKYDEKYDRYFKEGSVAYTSKVIPINQSLDVKQWIMPAEQVRKVLEKAEKIAIANCVCRKQNKRCGNPLDVCLYLNDFAKKFIAKGDVREINIEEAIARVNKSNELGLVHLTLYQPKHQIFAFCCCCKCCCHDLQLLFDYNRKELTAHSDFIEETNSDLCTNCATCINRCVFKARNLDDKDSLIVNKDLCYGCGLCVTTCPADAIKMIQRT